MAYFTARMREWKVLRIFEESFVNLLCKYAEDHCMAKEDCVIGKVCLRFNRLRGWDVHCCLTRKVYKNQH